MLFVIVVAGRPRAASSPPTARTRPIGIPGQGPSGSAPLGLDFLGRDVLSRVLSGGRSTLLLGGAATALIYLVGVTIGLIAGYSRSLVDPVLMRTVDLFLSFPGAAGDAAAS